MHRPKEGKKADDVSVFHKQRLYGAKPVGFSGVTDLVRHLSTL